MGFTYHIGIRHIVLEDAPVLNGNAFEDACGGIQTHLNMNKFLARELFYPNEQTCGGTQDSVFACFWSGPMAQGIYPQLPPGLSEHAEMIMSESWSEPYSIELPGQCDILVPNLPSINDSMMMNHLNHSYQLPEYKVSPHTKVFGKEKILMKSLNAEIEVIEARLAEGSYLGEDKDGIERVLEKLKLAKEFSLFVTFRY